MKKYLLFLLCIAITCIFDGCKDKNSNDLSNLYEPLEGTILKNSWNWYTGDLIYYVFHQDGSFQQIWYSNAEGCEYTDKETSFYKYKSTLTGHYYRDNTQQFISYILIDAHGNECKVHLWNDTYNNHYELSFGNYYGSGSKWDHYYCEKVFVIPSSDIINYDGTPHQNSGGSTGGTTGGTTGGGGTSDPTAGYTITPVSVCAIYMLDNKNTGDKYTKSYYKWVSSTGRVILSISATNTAYWIGVASKNYDSTRGGYPVSGYSYRYIDYTPVGGAWYYYFN